MKNFVTDPKGIKTSKNKKKNRRKKDQQKNSSLKEASVPEKKVVVNVLFCCFIYTLLNHLAQCQ